MIRLIVNADDFGLSQNINKGIAKAFQRGIVTSASVMANAPAFADACSLAQKTSLPVGVHLNLTCCAPVLTPQEVPSLVDGNGRFFSKWKFTLRFLMQRIRPEEIEAELAAQIQRLLTANIRPTHLDSHHHIHCLPGLARIVMKLAEKHGINNIRFISWPKKAALGCLSAFASQALLGALSAISYPHKERRSFYGFEFMMCRNKKRTLLRILDSLDDGIHELMCHPGVFEETDNIDSFYSKEREQELVALCDESVVQKISERKIKLISHDEI